MKRMVRFSLVGGGAVVAAALALVTFLLLDPCGEEHQPEHPAAAPPSAQHH